MSNLTIRPYTPELIPALLTLAQSALGDSGAVSKTSEFWHWKHVANPFGPSYGLVAWDETTNQAAGMRVLLRWHFTGGQDRIIQAVRAVDTATHADYRRQGIFSNLTTRAIDELSRQGVDLIFNTPNSASLPGYLKMGWKTVSRWPLYLCPLRPLRMALRRLRPLRVQPDWTAYFAGDVLTWAAFRATYGSEIDRLTAIWELSRLSPGKLDRLHTCRTPAYLDWRYGSHPHVTYGVVPLHAERNNKLTGYAVLRPNLRYGWQEVVLTELVLTEPDAALGRRLLAQVRQQVRGDYLIAHFAHNTFDRRLLLQTGFLSAPGQGITFVVRPLQAAESALVSEDIWDLSLGDLELF